MKKVLLAILTVFIVAAFALTACGQKKEEPKPETASAPAQVAPADTDTDADKEDDDDGYTVDGEYNAVEEDTDADEEDDSDAPDDKQDVNVNDKDDWDELADRVTELLNRAAVLQKVDACGLDADSEDVYTDEAGHSYRRVTDPQFQSIGDIWAYLYDTFTSDGAEQTFPYLSSIESEENDPPIYIYVNEGLYMLDGGKGFSSFEPTGPVEIKDASVASFEAVAPYDDFGQAAQMTVYGVKEDGSWKISSIER